MMQALSLAETAAAIGRSDDWLRDNWRLWHKAHRFPPPIFAHGKLTWDAAAVHAWLVRDLSPELRAVAAAYRAAYAAARTPDAADAFETASRDELTRRRQARVGANPQTALAVTRAIESERKS